MSKILAYMPTTVIFVLIIGAIIFYAGIFPGWMLIDCAISKRLSNRNKALWMLAILFIWPFGGFLYGFFDSGKQYVKKIAGAIFLVTFALLVLFLVFLPKLKSTLHKESAQVVARLDQIEILGASIEDKNELRASVQQVQRDMDDQGPFTDKRMVYNDLIKLLDQMSPNNQLSIENFHTWIEKFRSREILDRRSFDRYVRDFKRTPS